MNDKAEIKKRVQGLSRSINELRDELCIAVNEECYEDAAVIRDKAASKQQELTQLLITF